MDDMKGRCAPTQKLKGGKPKTPKSAVSRDGGKMAKVKGSGGKKMR